MERYSARMYILSYCGNSPKPLLNSLDNAGLCIVPRFAVNPSALSRYLGVTYIPCQHACPAGSSTDAGHKTQERHSRLFRRVETVDSIPFQQQQKYFTNENTCGNLPSRLFFIYSPRREQNDPPRAKVSSYDRG